MGGHSSLGLGSGCGGGRWQPQPGSALSQQGALCAPELTTPRLPRLRVDRGARAFWTQFGLSTPRSPPWNTRLCDSGDPAFSCGQPRAQDPRGTRSLPGGTGQRTPGTPSAAPCQASRAQGSRCPASQLPSPPPGHSLSSPAPRFFTKRPPFCNTVT